MSLQNRLKKIERQITNDDETVVLLYLDAKEHSSCNMRRDDCQPYPCNDEECWFSRRYPDTKRIVIDNDIEV